MKKLLLLIFLSATLKFSMAQDTKQKIERACLEYLEGFYEGDSTKLIRTLKPSLYKFGYWKNKTTGVYEADGNMTYRQALDYSKNVLAKKNFAKPDSPKKVEILDIGNTIASAKVSAWWGIDYILLSKQGDHWMIEQVLWEGPPAK